MWRWGVYIRVQFLTPSSPNLRLHLDQTHWDSYQAHRVCFCCQAKLRMLILISMIHLSSAAQPLRECKLSNHSWRLFILFWVNLNIIMISHSSTFCQPWHNCGQWVFIWRLFCNTIPCSLLWHGWSQPLHLLLLLLLLLLLRSLVSDPSLAVLSSRDLRLDFMWASCPSPWTQVDGIVAATRELAASGAIDPVEEMSEDQVEILSSFCQLLRFSFSKDTRTRLSPGQMLLSYTSSTPSLSRNTILKKRVTYRPPTAWWDL